MPGLIEKPLRFVLQRAKAVLKENATVRNVLSDIASTEEFGHLYEHEVMVADAVRVNAYRDAIARNVRPDDAVVDLGTGTGILALFAARARPRKLYAIDHSSFIEIAKRIASHNGVESIEFVRTNSRDFAPAEKLDLVIHEQIGDDLFDENMLENLLDLKQRVLKPTGRILPGRFELFLEPISLKPEFRVPRLPDSVVHGIDFRCLRGMEEVARYLRPDYDHGYLRTGSFAYFLSEPAPIMTFDMNDMTRPDELPRSFEAQRTVVRPGPFDGLCLYFRVIFDDEVSFETSPAQPRTHWGNRMFRADGRDRVVGDTLSYRFAMHDPVDVNSWVISFDGAAS